MVQTEDLGYAPIRKLFFAYYFPAVVSMLSVTVHQIVDGVILGAMVGKEGVAAIGLYAPVLIVFIAIELMLMVGGGILFSQYIGAKKPTKAQQVFQFTSTITIALGALIAFSSPWLAPWVTKLLAGGEQAKIYQYTYDYAFWSLLWVPVFLLRVLWGGFTNNDRAPKVSRNATMLGAVVNIILDVWFVLGLKWGVAGAAIATGIALMFSLGYIGFYIYQSKNNLTFKGFRLSFKLSGWKRVFELGFPSFASELAFAVGFILINQYMIQFGKHAVASFGIINYLSFIFFRFFAGVTIALQPLMAFNMGAGKPQRVLAFLRFGLFFSLGLGLLTIILGHLGGHYLLLVFSRNAEQAFYAIANPGIQLYFYLFLGIGINNVLSLYLQSIRKATLTSAMNIARGLGLVFLFLWLFSDILGWAIQAIWLVKPLAEVLTFTVLGGYTLLLKGQFYNTSVIAKNTKV